MSHFLIGTRVEGVAVVGVGEEGGGGGGGGASARQKGESTEGKAIEINVRVYCTMDLSWKIRCEKACCAKTCDQRYVGESLLGRLFSGDTDTIK